MQIQEILPFFRSELNVQDKAQCVIQNTMKYVKLMIQVIQDEHK